MKLNISVDKMVKHKLLPNQIVLLLFLYHKDFTSCKNLFGKELCYELRNSLVDTSYVLSKKDTNFTETQISKDKIEKLLGIKVENIDFWEFYTEYPIKVGSRVLRSVGRDTEQAKKHEEKYLKKVKTKEQHSKAIAAVKAYVAKKKANNELQFLEMMETVLNNSLWQVWETFIEDPTNNKNWYEETI